MELLSPAGSIQAAYSAYNAGADAVYLGGGFSARAYAQGISLEEIADMTQYAHLFGKKLYAAVNTMLFDDELGRALEHVEKLYDMGIDAVIMADIGLIAASRALFKNLPIHLSTQAGVHDEAGARLALDMGICRVVPARETTLDGLKGIAATGIEVEAFCHGALCSGYSGACLFSSLIGARSGNRGKCAQPCRMPYELFGERSYALSTADLCTVDFVKKLEDAGVCSLKIEGRMKSPEYVAEVTRIYRAAIDGKREKDDVKKLKQIFNRGGFTQGYFFGKIDVTYTKRPDHIGVEIGKVIKILGKNRAEISSNIELKKLDALCFSHDAKKSIVIGYADRTKNGYIVPIPPGVKIGDSVTRTASEEQLSRARDISQKMLTRNADARLFLSDKSQGFLRISSGGMSARADIPACERANKLMNEERLAQSVKKTGGTGFIIDEVEVKTDGQPYISAAQLNDARRQCIDRLKAKITDGAREYAPEMGVLSPLPQKMREGAAITASVTNTAQARAALDAGAKRVYVYPSPSTIHEEFSALKGRGIYIALAPFTTRSDIEKLKRISGFYDGAICSGWGEIAAAIELFDDVRADFLMNIANSRAQMQLSDMGICAHTVSAEISLNQMKTLVYPFEMIAYGHIPLMFMRHCPVKKAGHCGQCADARLKDRRGYEIRTWRSGLSQCDCVLLNPVLTAVENVREVTDAGANALRLMFFYEDEAEVARVVKMYKDALSGGKIIIEEEHNSAHLYRGV